MGDFADRRQDADPQAPSRAPAATASARNSGGSAYWLVWLVGLIAALQPLGLSGVLTPVTSMTNEVFAFLPRLLGAGLFFFAGLILARIVRHIIEAALGALNLERLAGRAGLKLGDAPVAVDSRGTASEGVAPARSSIAPRGRRDRLGDDHHLRRDRRAPDPADLGDQRSRDAMLNTIATAIPRVLGGDGVAGDRLPHRQMGQDVDRNRAAQPRLRQ